MEIAADNHTENKIKQVLKIQNLKHATNNIEFNKFLFMS